MRVLLLAVVLVVACGDTSSSTANLSAVVDQLGAPCTPSRPTECPVLTGRNAGLICGNDRFGWTCTAYCSDEVCNDPRAKCLDRIGAEDAGLPGFCWKRCASTEDCTGGLRCDRDAGVCGP